MGAQTRFIADNPWQLITKLSQKSKGGNFVAVPFLHSEATSILPLKPGDTLKVNIMSGGVHPEELRKYQKNKVSLYTCPNLHAKVFVLGETAVVGSTNVSKSSRDVLHEAIFLTTVPALVKEAREFVESLYGFRVDDHWLGICTKVYKPPLPNKSTTPSSDTERFCRKVMKLVAPGAVTHDGKNNYYIALKGDAVAGAVLRFDDSEDGEGHGLGWLFIQRIPARRRKRSIHLPRMSQTS